MTSEWWRGEPNARALDSRQSVQHRGTTTVGADALVLIDVGSDMTSSKLEETGHVKVGRGQL